MINKEMTIVKIEDLVHAEWNPRAAADLLPGNPEIIKLTEAIRAVGVLQPICVWYTDDGDKIIIAGNRRVEAAKAAGLETIPATVYTGLNEVQAREITRVENEVRLGVNAIADAALVGSMLRLGYTQKEIAAHFGVSEAKICRRAKLLQLIPEIRALATSHDISTDALERIALFSVADQNKSLKNVEKMVKKSDGIVHWEDLSYYFDNNSKVLDDKLLDTCDCKSCPMRTGAMADLWGDVDDNESLGKCLSSDCYAIKIEANHIKKLTEKFGSDYELINTENTVTDFQWWEVDKYKRLGLVSDEPVKGVTTHVYWKFTEWNKDYKYQYGISPELLTAALEEVKVKELAAAEELAAKRAAENKAYNDWAEAKKPIRAKYDKAGESLRKIVNKVSQAKLAKLLTKHVFTFKGAKVVSEDYADHLKSWNANLDIWATLLDRFPAICEELAIDKKVVNAYLDADSELEKWLKKHPSPNGQTV